MSLRWAVGAASLVSIACVIAAGTAFAGGGTKVATGTDPYQVTAKRLKDELRATGIDIRFIQPSHEPMRTVAGVGRSGESSIAFEFQLYPKSEEASVRQLGLLKPRDFGWSIAPLLAWEPRIRGVLANVAYAEYELVKLEFRHPVPHRTLLRWDRTHRSVLRALDDALFRSFPKGDAFAHPLMSGPNGSK